MRTEGTLRLILEDDNYQLLLGRRGEAKVYST
jgi:hypothetical protein